MRPLDNYDVYIFDCDGVILDTNRLKVDAMGRALRGLQQFPAAEIDQCLQYFAENFGKSRFAHIRHFVDDIFALNASDADEYYGVILEQYSSACRALYLEAAIAPGLVSFVTELDGDKYVASGSVQDELRWVFAQRGLDRYFRGIFGAPHPKRGIVADIQKNNPGKSIVFIGDSESDFHASTENNVDFVFYSKFSLVQDKMLALAGEYGFTVLNEFP